MNEHVRYQYKRIFDPPDAVKAPETVDLDATARAGDHLPQGGYSFYSERAVLAVNVALAAGRPLLVSGEPGSGKSTLAKSVADLAGWDYFQFVVTSRTVARDLMWTFDAVSRLRDAQIAAAGGGMGGAARKPGPAGSEDDLENLELYVRPSPLWQVLDPEGAAAMPSERVKVELAEAPSERAVLLIDEIDKADPDIPNDLLGVLGNFSFDVTDLRGRRVRDQRAAPPLVVVTTNGERDLPQAFLRRCVVLSLDFPNVEQLVEIASLHYGSKHRALHHKLARLVTAQRNAARGATRQPSTAEYLDAVETCLRLEIDPPVRDDQDQIDLDGISRGEPDDPWPDLWRSTLAKWLQAAAPRGRG